MSLKNLCQIVFCLAFLISLFSCQKAEPDSYSIPALTAAPARSAGTPDTTPAFSASVNGISVENFTPSKNTNGSYSTLTGKNTYYTITITIPKSTGPGKNYTIGTAFGNGIGASCISGSTLYYVNQRYGLGNLTIDSISAKGNYYGSFSFTADDTVTLNNVSVSQGTFYNL